MPKPFNSINAIATRLGDIAIKKCELVLVGTAAMMAHGLRDSADDIDVYCKDKDVLRHVDNHNPDDIDMTSDAALWGQLVVKDILSSGVVFEAGKLKLMAASIETLFILKADAAREKDIECLPILAANTTPERIAERMGALRQQNDETIWINAAMNLFAEMQAQYMTVPCVSWARSAGMNDSEAAMFCRSFGISDQMNRRAGL